MVEFTAAAAKVRHRVGEAAADAPVGKGFSVVAARRTLQTMKKHQQGPALGFRSDLWLLVADRRSLRTRWVEEVHVDEVAIRRCPAFAAEFEKLVMEAYEELFELHGDSAWTQDRNGLTQFFRTTDHSSDVVGTRQAGTFSALAALSGHAEVPVSKASVTVRKPKPPADGSTKTKTARGQSTSSKIISPGNGNTDNGQQSVGLTVRIEVNLPASGDQETYDRIFQSIRKNLLNG
jgi:hypothetical protein